MLVCVPVQLEQTGLTPSPTS